MMQRDMPVLPPERGTVLTVGGEAFVSGLTDCDVARAKRELVVFPREGGKDYGFGEREPLRLWSPLHLLKQQPGGLVVPRQYVRGRNLQWSRVMGGPDPRTYASFKWVGDAEHAQRSRDAGKPEWFERQRIWSDSLIGALGRSYNVWGAIGQAPTSFGKTVSVGRVIARFERKTLVIVHKEFLMEQWFKMARDWLRCTEDELFVVQGPHIKVKGSISFSGCKFGVAMVESLTQNKYPSLYRWPGMVVCDEVHRMGVEQWHKACSMFDAKFLLGVSATPYRADGMDLAFRMTIGDVQAVETEWSVKAKVFTRRVRTGIHPSKYTWGRKTLMSRAINRIAEWEGDDDWVLSQVSKAVGAGRKVLVLSDRIAHLERLKNAYGSGLSYFGSDAPSDEAVKAARVLWGTFGKCKEGLDVPELDTLFLLTPRADVRQDIGRILRHCPTKKEPMVIDVVHEDIPFAEAFARKRRMIYSQDGHGAL